MAQDPNPDSPPRRRTRRIIAGAVIGAWVVIMVIAFPFAGKLGDVQRDRTVDYLPASAQSTQVAELARELPGGDSSDLVIVYHRGGRLTPADRSAAGQDIATLRQRYGLGAGSASEPVPSKDGTTVLYRLSVGASKGEPADVVKDVRALVDRHPAGLSVQVTGAAALKADLEKVFEGIDTTLLLFTVTVVAVLLILTYRSPFLWAVPLLVVGCGAGLAMATVYGLVKGFDVTVNTQSNSIMMVLIFGAGTDYALLVVARYREELRRHAASYDAMVAALRGCGPAVLASAGTVTAALLCMLAADLNSTRGLGPVGAAGILCALLAMLTLLPAILVLLGRRVFWPFVPKLGVEAVKKPGMGARLGGLISGRPLVAVFGSLVFLGVLALGVFALPGDLRQQDSFTDKPESVAGAATLSAAYPGQSGQPLTVLVHPENKERAMAAVRETSGIARAQSGRTGTEWTEIEAFPKDAAETPAEQATIERLRDRLRDTVGADALVGGPSAQQLDETTTTARDVKVLIPLVLGVVLLILVGLLRSLVAPVLLVGTVVAAWGAALGLAGLAIGGVFGFDGTYSQLPLLSFVFLVALGVDYGIFLMHRVREETPRHGTRQAALNGLSATAGVIASAGFVLAATFGVLMVLPLVLMVELGFTVAVGVLLTTLLVQPVLVTGAAMRLRERLWWPRSVPPRGSPEPAPEEPGRIKI